MSKTGRSAIAAKPAAIQRLICTGVRLLAICARCGNLGGRAGSASLCTEVLGHPFFRAEHTLDKCGNIQIRIELRPMQSKARRANLDVRQLVIGGVNEPFGKSHGESELDASVRRDHDPMRLSGSTRMHFAVQSAT